MSATPSPVRPLHLSPLQRRVYVKELDRRIRRRNREQCAETGAQARDLVELDRVEGYLDFGYPCLGTYAEQALDWPNSRVRELKALARRLPVLPRVAGELYAGELAWSKAVAIARAHHKAPARVDEGRALQQAHRAGVRPLKVWLAREVGETPKVNVSLGPLMHDDAAFLDDRVNALRAEGWKGTKGQAVIELLRRARTVAEAEPTPSRADRTEAPSLPEAAAGARSTHETIAVADLGQPPPSAATPAEEPGAAPGAEPPRTNDRRRRTSAQGARACRSAQRETSPRTFAEPKANSAGPPPLESPRQEHPEGPSRDAGALEPRTTGSSPSEPSEPHRSALGALSLIELCLRAARYVVEQALDRPRELAPIAAYPDVAASALDPGRDRRVS